MIARPRRFWVDCRGGVGAEFALLIPLLMIFIFGMIDVGRAMWLWNQAEKATQMGARYAVSTEMIPQGLATYSFATTGGIPQGGPIPEASFGGARCNSSGCVCLPGKTCPPMGTFNTTAFNNIVHRMQQILPQIEAENVEVEYGYSGLGYSGDPNGPDVAPLITVRVTGLTFDPMIFFGAGVISLPEFPATLSMEDGSGAIAN